MWDLSTGFAVIAVIMLIGEIIISETGGGMVTMIMNEGALSLGKEGKLCLL